MAKEGAPGEREVAARILKKHGITADELLRDAPKSPPIKNLGDEISGIRDDMIIEVSLGLRKAIQNLSDDLSSILSDFFHK